MSKNELKKTVESEIKRLNKIIDRKIIKGESYRTEAKRHLVLLKWLQKSVTGWNFSRAMSYVSLFFF